MSGSRRNVVQAVFGIQQRRSYYRTCQWPFGDPTEAAFHFCGKATHAPYSYCAEHAAMAFRDPEAERESARAEAASQDDAAVERRKSA